MREGEGGWSYIQDIVLKRLAKKHLKHLEYYGDNSKRLSGKFETSKRDVFTYGVGNRAASVRIPTETAFNKQGYIEDRRPASDIDPYVSCALMADTIILDGDKFKPLEEHFKAFVEFKKVTHFDM